jgi:hypothetical protein
VRRCRGERRLRRGDALKHHRGLSHKNLKNLTFKLTVAERHASKMRVVKHGWR